MKVSPTTPAATGEHEKKERVVQLSVPQEPKLFVRVALPVAKEPASPANAPHVAVVPAPSSAPAAAVGRSALAPSAGAVSPEMPPRQQTAEQSAAQAMQSAQTAQAAADVVDLVINNLTTEIETFDVENDVAEGPLAPTDMPIGKPLPWRVVHVDGTLLLDVGAVLATVDERDFLFDNFEPQRDVGADGPAIVVGSDDPAAAGGNSQQLSLSEMGLRIGSRLGVRGRLDGVDVTYASKLIGIAPSEMIFITPPHSSVGKLALEARDTVQVVAVSATAVYLFTSTVEDVNIAPSPYLILSKPRVIRRLRERRAERVKTRFPVMFSGGTAGAPINGMGLASDISDLGMALVTASDLGCVGDTVHVRFYLDLHASTLRIEAAGEIRNVKPLESETGPGGNVEYGLEFGVMQMESRLALRNFVLSHRTLG